MDEDTFASITFFCYNCGSSWSAQSSASVDMFNVICLNCLDDIHCLENFSPEDMAIRLRGINEEEGMGISYINNSGYLFSDQVKETHGIMTLYSVRYPLNFGFSPIYLYETETDVFTDAVTGQVIQNHYRNF